MNSRRGVTTLELVIVVLVLAILSVSAFVGINMYQGIKLQSAADKLAADIRYTQGQAMSTTTWHGIIFSSNSYTVYVTNGTTDTPVVDPANFSANLVVDLNDKFGVTINSVNLEGNSSKVEFNGLGRPYTDYSGWVVSQEGTVVLGLGGQTKTLTLTPHTGKVEVQ